MPDEQFFNDEARLSHGVTDASLGEILPTAERSPLPLADASPLATIPPLASLVYSALPQTRPIPPLAIAPIKAAKSRRRFQFNLSALQLIFLVAGVVSAGLGGLLRMNTESEEFVAFALILMFAPLGLLILLGMLRGGYEVWKNYRREQEQYRKQPNNPWDEKR